MWCFYGYMLRSRQSSLVGFQLIVVMKSIRVICQLRNADNMLKKKNLNIQ